MSVIESLALAQQHLGQGSMVSSAALCLSDAINLFNRGDFENAKSRAAKSLLYSVGAFHPDYKQAAA